MINQGNNVPDKTIAVFQDSIDFNMDSLNTVLGKMNKKRDWFNKHFYKCLPLTIANEYGFIIKSQFDIDFVWNGENDPQDIQFFFKDREKTDKQYPRVESHFGSGIITINTPFTLRTPPGINIMTINPPNIVLPNITVMTGVVEADNLRRNFTFNLKIQMPNLRVFIPAGTPLAGFIPIPRYFGDSFEIKKAEDIFDEETILEEMTATFDSGIYRNEIEPKLPNQVGRHYFHGVDVYGNKFPDHQHP